MLRCPFRCLAATVIALLSGLIFAAKSDSEPLANTREVLAIGVLFEWIEVDDRTAGQLLLKASGDAAIRERLEEMLDAGQAELVETSYAATASDEKFEAASVLEVIYPVSGDPPEIPQSVELDLKEEIDLSNVTTPTSPTAADVREVGTLLKCTAEFDDEPGRLTLDLDADRVLHLGGGYIRLEPYPDPLQSPLKKPLFHSMRSVNSLDLKVGVPTVAGSFTPPGKPNRRILLIIEINPLK